MSANTLPSFELLPPSPATYSYPGAKWWKVDFHTHTPHSTDYADRAGSAKETLKAMSPEQWLLHHMAWGLDAVVITDHNGGGWIDLLKTAYIQLGTNKPEGFRPLVIFPGIEISVTNGLHLLAIFDPSCGSEKIAELRGAVRLSGNPGDPANVSSLSFEDCIDAIRDRDGLSIPAHVDDEKGLLFEETGVSSTIAKILDAGLSAIEVRDWEALSPALRVNPKLARLARVRGSDSHTPSDIGRNGFSLVHMSEPTREGLRLAFADGARPGGESWSVKQVAADDLTDHNKWSRHALESIEIRTLKMAGNVRPLHIPLHPRLNVFVGCRGSGKSTIVHALRLATDRGQNSDFPRFDPSSGLPKPDSPAGDFWRWSKLAPTGRNRGDGVLRSGSSIDIVYRAPAQRMKLAWTGHRLTVGGPPASMPPTVESGDFDQGNGVDAGAYASDRFPISIYSQKQIIELARNPRGLLGIIDREQRVPELQNAFDQSIRAYMATRSRIRELQAQISSNPQDIARFQDITAELVKVQSDVVKTYQVRQSQAQFLLPDYSLGSPIDSTLNEVDRLSELIRLPNLPLEYELSFEDGILYQAVENYEIAKAEIERHARELTATISSIRGVLDTLATNQYISTWGDALNSAAVAYEQLLGATNTSLDPQRIIHLNEERVQIEQRIARHKNIQTEISRLGEIATEQLRHVRTARLAISLARDEFISRHNSHRTLLRIRLECMAAAPQEIEGSFRKAIGVETDFDGAISPDDDGRDNALLKPFSPEALRQAMLNPAQVTDGSLTATPPSPGELASNVARTRVLSLIDEDGCETGFTTLQNKLKRDVIANPARRELIETWYPEDSLKLDHRPDLDAQWVSISEGSIGQQTAAILSFLLSFGEEPLVLDQPEDDLDTRMIMNLVVDQIRTMKTKRQIIVVTHNPNIVVHGDAELIHAMENRSGQVLRLNDESGGLQQSQTRSFICEVMEGGNDAFQKRYERMRRNQ